MKKKILGVILSIFGFVSFLGFLTGADTAERVDPGAFVQGATLATVSAAVGILVILGAFFYNRMPDPPTNLDRVPFPEYFK